MIASLLKFIVLFFIVYLLVKFIRFLILVLKAATANINNASKNNNNVEQDKSKKSDVIELKKDQYRVD